VIAPARRAAYRILLDVERGQGDLPHALAASRAHLTDPRDQALAAQIALGTLRWQGALDHLVAHFARRPVASLDREVRLILRTGAYQLLHLARVPASAVVNDSVSLVREARKSSAAGFANAVLRGIDRQRNALPLPARPASSDDAEAWLDYLAITLSHPRWLVARWLARYGAEATERWLRFNNEDAPLTLRANRLRLDRDELAARLAAADVETVPTPFAPDGLLVTRGNPLRSGFDQGLFVVQDEASQLVGAMLPLGSGDRVLDACASPGGKTTQLAAALDASGTSGVVVASDVRARRVALLTETVRRSGARNVRILQADFAAAPPFGSVFDAVLLDAPCSGLGTLRRDPDIKWRRVETDVLALAERELLMLEHASHCVRPGGHLLYSTCSSEPEENEEVVRVFLARNPEFSGQNPSRLVELGAARVVDAAGQLRTHQHVHHLEAFFGALLVRQA
jgi:16S rRNA (cytosine967-C5)-methyltransferase